MFRRQSICIFTAACALILLAILAACGGNASSPAATASAAPAPPAAAPAPPTPTPPPPPAQYLYAWNFTATGTAVDGFRINSDGTLTPLGVLLQTSQLLDLMVADPSGQFVYASVQGDPSGPGALVSFRVQESKDKYASLHAICLTPPILLETPVIAL
jgi:hypothetical protein